MNILRPLGVVDNSLHKNKSHEVKEVSKDKAPKLNTERVQHTKYYFILHSTNSHHSTILELSLSLNQTYTTLSNVETIIGSSKST